MGVPQLLGEGPGHRTDHFTQRRRREIVPRTQPKAGLARYYAKFTWSVHRAPSYSSLDSWALLASDERGHARTNQNRKVDRKSPRARSGGFFIFKEQLRPS